MAHAFIPHPRFPPHNMDSTRKVAKYLAVIALLVVAVAILYVDQFPDVRYKLAWDAGKQKAASLNAVFTYSNSNGECPEHRYEGVKIVSRAPDIMLINGFMSQEEADALIRLAFVLFGCS
jgi:hypothetical protein